jgi:murein L,D-transpeptidase YcbB/YkuD
MRGPSLVTILGAGFFVLVAQLVVWLTPVRSLLIDIPENPAALDVTETREGDARRPGAEEAPVPAEETVAQAAALPESGAEGDASRPGAEEAPVPAEETVAQGPALPEPEAESGMSPAGAEETPAAAAETVAQAPALPESELEAEGDASRPSAEETPAAAAENVAQAPAPDKLFIVDTIRLKLNDPALRKGAHADDLAALEAFYVGYNGPARWVTDAGLTPPAQTIIGEIAKADDWGLDASALQVPPPDFRPTVAKDQAAVEIALDVAILKYARAAQGGRADPRAASRVFAQEPTLREPATILTEIFAAPAPDAYLRDFHPKHAQFERLRQALLKARAEDEAKPDDLNKLRVNMERWRWMPADLGAIYVWLNIPEFMVHVVKDGKTIHSEKVVVGNPNSPTPVLSADLKSIIFSPYRVVPLSIIRKNVLPALQKDRSSFGGNKTSVLEHYQLEVKRKGKPIDPTKIDWENVNLANLTFVQAPGPTNILGKVQFLFPNPRGVYLHETIVPSQLERAVRAVGQNSPRVGNPDKFAGVLLTEDKGWEAAKIAKLMAGSKNTEVKLDRPIPVHMTYFTVVADEEGKLRTIADVYGLDAAVEAAILGKVSPAPGVAEPVPVPPRKPSANGSLATSAP